MDHEGDHITQTYLTASDVDALAEGAAVLGTGGGGNTYLAGLDLKRVLGPAGSISILAPESLADDAWGPVISGMGAPTVGIERLPTAGRFARLVRAAEHAEGRRADFVAIGEIGGANALRPLCAAAESALPVVDADPMGRAFPELQMCTYMVGGVPPQPLVLNDGKGVEALLTAVPDSLTAERYGRALTWGMGGSTGLALGKVNGTQVRALGIPGTLSLALAIGREMAKARAEKRPTTQAVFAVVPDGRHLFTGKIVDVARRTAAGFARGTMSLEGLGDDRGRRVRVEFQNEYLVCREEGASDGALCTVPDLLVLVEQESGRALSTELLRYGLRIDVLALPAPAELRKPAMLSAVGPGAFGYDLPYHPLPGDLLHRTGPV